VRKVEVIALGADPIPVLGLPLRRRRVPLGFARLNVADFSKRVVHVPTSMASPISIT